MDLSYILNHLGEEREHYFQAISPPIIQSSNFHFESLEKMREGFADEYSNHVYTRGNNPTVNILRKKIAALEKTEDSLIFSSGSSAIGASVISLVESGDHIVCVDSPYSWTNKLLKKFLPKFGVTTTFVDGTSLKKIEEAIIPEKTKLLFLESPNSLSFALQDLEGCAKLCKKYNLISLIDNSYSSPINQNPSELGIDLVLHSGTKYLNGHSDVVMGVCAGPEKLLRKIFESAYMTLGTIISPNDAFLAIRGMRTLPLRIEKSQTTCIKLIEWLGPHRKIEAVHYPFNEDFPQYELAKKQMKGCGGLFSFYLKAEKIEEAERFHSHLKCFLTAVSWGGHESLILPAAGFYKIPGLPDSVIPWNYFRVYVGLEEFEYLKADLEQALEKIDA
jgi:cystathionine beta-lyase/cystathionine gamma-synthase